MSTGQHSTLWNCCVSLHFLFPVKIIMIMSSMKMSRLYLLLETAHNSVFFSPQMEIRLPFIILIYWDFVRSRRRCIQKCVLFFFSKSIFKANFQNGCKIATFRMPAGGHGCLQEGHGFDAWVWQSPSVLSAGAATPRQDVQGRDAIKGFKIKQRWAPRIWLNPNFPPRCVPTAFSLPVIGCECWRPNLKLVL